MAKTKTLPISKRVDPKWIRTAADRAAIVEGCWFDEKAGNRVCEFIETFCCQSIGRWEGKTVELMDWQRDFIMRLFGWKRPDGFRRFRTAYLEVAKKNGKSTLVSCIALYCLLADSEATPNIYLNACDKEQASIIFDEAVRMINASDSFKSRLVIINSNADKRIVSESNNGKIVANSSVSGSKDGFNSHVTIFDELHRQLQNRALWNVFRHAGISREQPFILSITTAGEEEAGIWFEQREHSEQIIKGQSIDTSHLGVVYRCDPKDNLDDPAVWRKANPGMGVTMKEAEFAREWETAKQSPVDRAEFLRFRFCIVIRSTESIFPPGAWEACSEQPVFDNDEPLYAGFDLSSVDDLTAVCWGQGNDEDGYDVEWFFYLPEDNIVALEKQHKQHYRVWADQGLITLTPGARVDYKYVRRDILKRAEGRNLKLVLGDPYAANGLLNQLIEDDGLPGKQIQQGFISLSPPTKQLIGLVKEKKIHHGGNPIANWHAGNAVASKDEADNMKIGKKKSRGKIDGIAALVNMIAGTINADDEGESVYESRGIMMIGSDD